MKKIILVFSLLYSIFGFGKVNIDEVYSNAKLNIDFSSSMVFSDKQNVIEKELADWILSNPNRFEDVNKIKIAYEPKWYWGSWKKVVRGLEFVKKENVQKRIAYYEDLRKRNEEEFRRQQERKTFLTALGVAAASYLGVKIYENRYEIANFIKENWNNSSSNYYTDNNDSKKETEKENNSETLKNSEIEKINKEKHIEFVEERTTNCNKGTVTYYKVYLNGKKYDTKSVGDYDNHFWDGCAGQTVSSIVGLQTKEEKSKTTLKQFLIRRYESETSSADSYTLTTK